MAAITWNSYALKVVQRFHPGVSRVVDGKAPIAVEVTEEDCRDGKLGEPASCAMAVALGRVYDAAIISKSTAYLVKGRTAVRYKVPNSVTRELVAFDRSGRFMPGTYKLMKIEPSRGIGVKRTPPNRTDPKKRYKGSKRKYHRTIGVRSLTENTNAH